MRYVDSEIFPLKGGKFVMNNSFCKIKENYPWAIPQRTGYHNMKPQTSFWPTRLKMETNLNLKCKNLYFLACKINSALKKDHLFVHVMHDTSTQELFCTWYLINSWVNILLLASHLNGFPYLFMERLIWI